jgi:hypothetical protein
MFLVKSRKQLRRLIIAVIGFTVLAVGVALLVLPGPAILVIPAGLGILSIEFAWARNLLKKMKEKMSRKRRPDPTHADRSHQDQPPPRSETNLGNVLARPNEGGGNRYRDDQAHHPK